MAVTHGRSVCALIGLVAIGYAGAGCGSSSAPSTASSSASTSTLVTPARAAAFARAVNLQAVDLPDLLASGPEQNTKNGPGDRALARCVGGSDPRRVVAKIHSATFKYQRGFGEIKSAVEVEPSEAVVLQNYRAALTPRLLTCLKSLLPGVLTVKTEGNGTRYGAVSVTRMPALSIPDSFGVEIRTSVISPRLPYPVPIYFDEIGFVAGTAEVSLAATGAPRPVEAELEARLASLLYRRATAYKL